MAAMLALMQSEERFTESVRMYVMRPDSYSRWATIMVCATVKPSLWAASCCRVEVVNGAAGVRFCGRVVISPMVNVASLQFSRKRMASSLLLKR